MNRTLIIPDDLYRQANVVAATCRLSFSEFARAALRAAIETCGERDPILGIALRYMDEKDNPPLTLAPLGKDAREELAKVAGLDR